MTQPTSPDTPVFELRADLEVAAPPATLYRLVSDLRNSGVWSPECLGGEWLSGGPGKAGSVFRGENLRGKSVVAWAPVVRGTWYTEAEVVAAEQDRTFQWAMLTKAGRRQDSVWGFDLEPTGNGTRLVHHFRMGEPTEGIRGITAEMSATERAKFFTEWSGKLEDDLAATLRRIKSAVEKG